MSLPVETPREGENTIRIRPQPGPQTAFLSSTADIVVYGGTAGCAKSFGLLLEAARHTPYKGYSAVIFRRTTPMIRNAGGLWDESFKVFTGIGGVAREQYLDWEFPTGSSVSFAHMEHGKNRFDWKGAQITLVGFDELCDFEEEQFWYMLSRNRSVCGVRPYVRATCNPDPDSFVADMISWWIDQKTGFPIPERSGVIRYFVRLSGEMFWADTAEKLIAEHPGCLPKSFTFIPGKLSDNKILEDADPGYRANLMALDPIERARLLDGNWKIKDKGIIRREWFPIIPDTEIPADLELVRWADLAATENGGDYTSSILLGRSKDGIFYILDVIRGQWSTGERDKKILAKAIADRARYGNRVTQCTAIDPGQAGKSASEAFVKMLAGFPVFVRRESGDKVDRSQPWRSQAENGNFRMVRAPWNAPVLSALCTFSAEGKYIDDDVDAISGAFNKLTQGGVINWWRDRAAERAERDARSNPQSEAKSA